jgi:hypothetical protein
VGTIQQRKDLSHQLCPYPGPRIPHLSLPGALSPDSAFESEYLSRKMSRLQIYVTLLNLSITLRKLWNYFVSPASEWLLMSYTGSVLLEEHFSHWWFLPLAELISHAWGQTLPSNPICPWRPGSYWRAGALPSICQQWGAFICFWVHTGQNSLWI